MSWDALRAAQKIKTHSTSKRELDDLRTVIARDLADAALPGLSADRRFATAYNAALQAATMVIACAGYRTSGIAHHQTTYEAAELALGPEGTVLLAYFDRCRRKRNNVDYDRAQVTTETEASEIVQRTHEFVSLIEEWIFQNYPTYQKPG